MFSSKGVLITMYYVYGRDSRLVGTLFRLFYELIKILFMQNKLPTKKNDENSTISTETEI